MKHLVAQNIEMHHVMMLFDISIQHEEIMVLLTWMLIGSCALARWVKAVSWLPDTSTPFT